MAEDKINDLIKRLASSDIDVLDNVVDALIEIGKQAVPALIEALKNEDDDVRWSAAEALGSIGDVSAVPALVNTLKDNDIAVRETSARALGEIGDARAVPSLVEALKDENVYVREYAAWALVKIISTLTDIHLEEIGKAEKVVREMLEKAEGEEKEDLLGLLETINKRQNELLEPEAKKLKPPKRIKKKGKPKRRMWRLRRTVC